MSMQLTTIGSHCPSSSLPILSRPEPERNIAKMFIENGIDFNVQDCEFRSAPHCLSENKSDNLLDVYELLIENGADVNGRNFKQENALHLLCKNNYQREYLIEIIRYFVNKGIDIKDTAHVYNAIDFLCQHHESDDDELSYHLQLRLFPIV